MREAATRATDRHRKSPISSGGTCASTEAFNGNKEGGTDRVSQGLVLSSALAGRPPHRTGVRGFAFPIHPRLLLSGSVNTSKIPHVPVGTGPKVKVSRASSSPFEEQRSTFAQCLGSPHLSQNRNSKNCQCYLQIQERRTVMIFNRTTGCTFWRAPATVRGNL